MSVRDPNAAIVATFKNHTIPNISKTAAMGRKMFDDMEICEIRFAGSRAVSVFPATAMSHWDTGPDGELVPITYAERFAHQYRQFKAQDAQTKAGTPLDYVPFLTEARRAELRALNVYTVEALAAVDGPELKNLGPGGREMKNKAMEFLEESKSNASTTAMQAELDAIKARNAILEEDMRSLKSAASPADPGDEFAEMTVDQLRQFIGSATGIQPHGTLSRKTLLRMAQDAQQKAA